jgi:hypothetical protein
MNEPRLTRRMRDAYKSVPFRRRYPAGHLQQIQTNGHGKTRETADLKSSDAYEQLLRHAPAEQIQAADLSALPPGENEDQVGVADGISTSEPTVNRLQKAHQRSRCGKEVR